MNTSIRFEQIDESKEYNLTQKYIHYSFISYGSRMNLRISLRCPQVHGGQ
jgi:hypothetical protein